MTGNRRYKIGKYPEYDKKFDRLVVESLILNSNRSVTNIQNFNTFHILRSKHGLERLLKEWRGEGGKLAEAENAIKTIYSQFERLKQYAINSGKFPPKEMPPEMRNELLRAEACEDVTKAEIKRLKKALKKAQSGKNTDHEMPCLPYGAIGSGKKRKGILSIIDGQDVLPDKNMVLRIQDERSPYNGMRCADYFEYIVKPYKQAEAQLMKGKSATSIVRKRPPLPDWPKNVKH